MSRTRWGFAAFAIALLAGFGFGPGTANAFEQSGIASYYRGGMTASGIRVSANEMVAAHKTLPLGSIVRVTNLRNGRTTTVRIVDRGPYIRGRIIDLTHAGARALGFYGNGLARVRIAVVGRNTAGLRYGVGRRSRTRVAVADEGTRSTRRQRRMRTASLGRPSYVGARQKRTSQRVRTRTARVATPAPSSGRMPGFFTRLSGSCA